MFVIKIYHYEWNNLKPIWMDSGVIRGKSSQDIWYLINDFTKYAKTIQPITLIEYWNPSIWKENSLTTGFLKLGRWGWGILDDFLLLYNLFHCGGRNFEVFICSFLSFYNQLTYVGVDGIFIQSFLPESLTVFLNAFPHCLGYTKHYSP